MQNNTILPAGTEVAVRLYNCKSGDMISVQVMKSAAVKLKSQKYSFNFKDNKMYLVPDAQGLRMAGGAMTTMNSQLIKTFLSHDAVGFYRLEQDAQNKRFYIDLTKKLKGEEEMKVEPAAIERKTAEESKKQPIVLDVPSGNIKKTSASSGLIHSKIDNPVTNREVDDEEPEMRRPEVKFVSADVAESKPSAFDTARELFYKKLIKAVKEDNFDKAKLVVELIEEFEEAL